MRIKQMLHLPIATGYLQFAKAIKQSISGDRKKASYFFLVILLFLTPVIASAQSNLSGRVTGEPDQKPVEGATIRIKGTNKATQTSKDGKFSIDGAAGDIMVISHINFQEKEIQISTGNQVIAVVLASATSILSDVVVVGYGSQSKRKVTSAISTVKMDEVLGERPVSTTATLLQGIIPGLQVTIPSGRPGENANLNIRGATGLNTVNNTITSGSPLILVDNIVFDGALNLIDPNDIETVTVLKDAGAAAIYGARSAYGVVLIQTKRGSKNQKAQFTYSNNIVFASPDNIPIKASPQKSIQALIDGGLTNYTVGQGQELSKWISYFEEYAENPGKFPGGYAMDNSVFYNLKGNDAVNDLLGSSAVQFMNNLSISGGSDKTTYRISLGSTNEKGIMVPSAKVDNFKRYNFRSVLSTEVTDWMTAQVDASYNHSNTTSPGYSDPYTYAVRIPSFLAADSIPGYPGQIATGENLVTNSYPTTNRLDQLRLTGRLLLRPLKNLTVTAEGNFDNSRQLISTFDKLIYLRDPYGWAPFPFGRDQYTKNSAVTDYTTFNVFATYKRSQGRHNFTLMSGFNQEFKRWEQEVISKTGIINASIPSISTSAGAFDGSDNYTEFATRGVFGRFNYDFADKYLLEINGRYDASSRFPEGNRGAFYPSFSTGWRVLQESFMSFAKPYISELKLRAAYGSVGNQNIGEYQFMASMNPTNPLWLNGSGRVVTLTAPSLVSPDYTWETISTFNPGITVGLLKNKLTADIDWYTRETKGILSRNNTAVPAVLGTTPPLVNSAAMKTNGFEIELNWRDRIGKVGYYVSANLYDYTSKVTDVAYNPNKALDKLYVGQKLGEIWGYTSDRLYQVSDFSNGSLDSRNLNGVLKAGFPRYIGQVVNPGDMLYKDLNNDSLINGGSGTVAAPGDRKIIGNSTLRYQFGIRGGVSYKGFDFSFVLTGVLKNDQFRNSWLFFPNNNAIYGAMYENQLDYWTPANPGAYFGRFYTAAGGSQAVNEQVQTRFLLNGAYMRVRNLSLRYNLPQGQYPDISSLGNGLGYPLMRKSSIGLTLSF